MLQYHRSGPNPLLWRIGKVDNPELIVKPETATPIASVPLSNPASLPHENDPHGLDLDPVVVAIPTLLVDDRTFAVIIPVKLDLVKACT